MTWNDLALMIEKMSVEQSNTDVAFFDNRNHFFPVKSLEFTDEETCDVLDHDHPFLTSL